jgi:hypothetical protein
MVQAVSVKRIQKDSLGGLMPKDLSCVARMGRPV